MCKINGHSIFSYMFQPVTNWGKLYNSKKNNTPTAEEETVEKVSDIETTSATAGTAKTNDSKRNDLSSLRIPLNTSSTGASTGGNTSVGLNLGGY